VGTKGDETRQRIIDTAVGLASVDGLGRMTIGELATTVGMSKSGLFAHFGSKEQLELAVVCEITRRFTAVVWAPATNRPSGRDRLNAVFGQWLRWVDGHHLPGGCPIIAVMADLDDRPGPARDHLAASQQAWLDVLEAEVATLKNGTSAVGRQFAFELQGIVMAYSAASRLLHDRRARAKARSAYAALMERYDR
jgi:AcrR family transcriptional regulator